MNVDKDWKEQQQTMKRKLNKRQQTRKVPSFKRKYCQRRRMPMKTILNKVYNEFKQLDLIQMPEDKTLIMSQPSLMKKKCYPLETESDKDPTVFLSDYSIMSSMALKEILLTTVSTETDKNALSELLNNEDIFTFTHQLTQLINKLHYLKLQNEQWTYYYHLGMTEGIWHGRVSKTMAAVNFMCYTYGRSKTLTEQRQKKYQQQLEQTNNEVNEYLKQASTHLTDTNKIMTIVNHLIHSDQYQLRIELERRRDMLIYDAKDHQLVQAFYQLKPRQTEIHSAKIIWKATTDEYNLRYEIAMFKTWFYSPSKTHSCTFRDLGLLKINETLTQLVFDQQPITNKNTSINQVDTMDNITQDSLTVPTLSITEQMAQSYTQKAADEKTKLYKTRDKSKNISNFDNIFSVIENRTNNLIQRAQCDTKQKLKTVFGENLSNTLDG